MQIDLLTEFDTPDCAFPVPRRSSTTSPLQALTLMNHQFTLDMAEAMAVQLGKNEAASPVTMDRQVTDAFVHCYGREPSEVELSACVKLADQHGLRSLCRVLLNSNEFIYLN